MPTSLPTLPAPATPASQHLLALASALAAAYQPLPTTQASMVTGSVAAGQSDFFSDIDMGRRRLVTSVVS
jgi:hypothetical protein